MSWFGVAENERIGATRLERWSGVGETKLRVRTNPMKDGIGWVVVGAYTTGAELKEVVNIESRDIVVSALANSHNPDDVVLMLDEPIMNVRWYGSVGATVTAGMLASATAQYAAVYGGLTPVIAEWTPALLGSGNVFSAPQHIGADAEKASLPGFSIARTLTDSENARGYHDASVFSGNPAKAYASFDAMAESGGTNNLDHLIGFQARSEHKGSGTLTDYYGFGAFPNLTGGAATRVQGFYGADPVGAGLITTLYGIYLESMTRGATNYAIYTNAGNISFGGSVVLRNGGLTTEAGGIVLVSTGNPIAATRNVALATGAITLALLLAKTSVNMTDGFGSFLAFNIQDDTSASLTLAQIGVVRAGADNIGDFVVNTNNAGTTTEKVRITGPGDVKVQVGKFFPVLKATAQAPAYAKGAIYFDTTLNKLRVGGATAWETITSA